MDKANKGKLDTNKLKAFNIGAMGVGKRQMSKREQEEYRKRLDKEEAAAVYNDFVASFEDVGKGPKVWVKGGTAHSEKGGVKQEKGSRLYKPTSRLSDKQSDSPASREREDEEAKKAAIQRKDEQKKKSNLELFKEELKMIQEERQERHRLKRGLKEMGPAALSPSVRGGPSSLSLDPADMNSAVMLGVPGDVRAPFNYDQLDDSTTNIYVGNINPKMTEMQLCEVFGKYGPLASIKIMWPRSEEERSRGRNCGFVAFMNRKDGERALNSLKGKDVFGFEMKLGWGKAVPIPPHPVYIPPALADLTMPPPPSGLPFNAQPKRTHPKKYGHAGPQSQIPPETPAELEKTLASAVVKVVMPTERLHLCLIHRMVEFVVREGPMFEAMIMNQELNNPQFRFLFDNQSIAHIYYRWRLFTLLQGDNPYKWRTDEFRMFKGGSYWRPPPMNPYTSGMPEELVSVADEGPTKGQLTDSQRDRLEDMLRELTPEKNKVGDVMVWCLDHADSAEEIVDCISEALSILQTPIPKKLARLFLVCDILYNSSAKVPNASFFRRNFQNKLKDIFKDVHEAYISIDGRLKAEQFKQKVMQCFRAWEDWAVYPNEFLISLQNIFLGLVINRPEPVEEEPVVAAENEFDGVPLADTNGDSTEGITVKPEIDGKPLVEDYDGDPIEDLDGDPMDKSLEDEKDNVSKFIQSKWETVDQAELESQAMTTSKWDLLDPTSDNDEGETSKLGESMDQDDDVDGLPFMDDDDDDAQKPTVPLTPRSISAKHSPSPSTPSNKEINPLDYYMGKPVQSASKMETGMSEERRSKLREIEVKVVKYQDEIEAGKRSRKAGMTLAAQAEYYRKKLLHKETKRTEKAEKEEKRRERELRERERERERRPQLVDVSSSSSESEPESLSSRRSYQSRNFSPLRRSRSGTPKRRKISRSPKRRHSRSRSRSRPRAALTPVSRSPPPRHKHKHKKKRRE